MLFNSLTFLVFFLIVLTVTYLSPAKLLKPILLLASLIFYIWWYPPYIIVLLGVITLHYFCCIKIEDARIKAGVSISPKLVDNLKPSITIGREYLVFGVVLNMLILVGFKYIHFFTSIFGYTLPQDFKWALPLGISFFTFHTISCTVDVYRGLATAKRNYIDFLFFVCYFPQLIAGPILRLKANWYALVNPKKPDYFRINEGIYLIFWGLLKKMVIADNLALFVEKAFHSPQDLNFFFAWLAVYAFAVQIYCDFSGYIDTAIGISKIFYIDLPKNFNFPYLSHSITEFWRRWHITLSTWLRDYLYIPLGGNHKGELRTSINLFATMLLGGLWHGASLNFLIWGGLHGFYLSVEKIFNRQKDGEQSEQRYCEEGEARRGNPLLDIFKIALTFHVVCLAWVFFRAKTLTASIAYITQLFSFSTKENLLTVDMQNLVPQILTLIGVALVLHLLNYKINFKYNFYKYRREFRIAFLLLSVVLILIFGVKQEVRFIYFDF